MIEIEIKNFQAIDSLKLTVEGFTALVGRTNIGKSSIVRAVKYALLGGSGTEFIRHDPRVCERILRNRKTCKCTSSVQLMFEEGQGFRWEKESKGTSVYKVWKDGVESVYHRVGQKMDLPGFLAERFSPIRLGPTQALLQVSSQFEAPFLLDVTGGVVADILSDVGQIDEVNRAMAAVAKDRKAAIAKRNVRDGDVAALSKQLETFLTLDEHLASVRQLRSRARAVEHAAARLSQATGFIDGVSEAGKALRRVTVALEHPAPDIGAMLGTATRMKFAGELLAAWHDRSEEIARVGHVLQAEVPERDDLVKLAESSRRVAAWGRAIGERQSLVSDLETALRADLPNLEPLRRLAADLLLVARWRSTLLGLKAAFDKAGPVQSIVLPGQPELGARCRQLEKASALWARHERLDTEIAETTKELAESTAELRAVTSEFKRLGICPTCRREITPGHVAVVCQD